MLICKKKKKQQYLVNRGQYFHHWRKIQREISWERGEAEQNYWQCFLMSFPGNRSVKTFLCKSVKLQNISLQKSQIKGLSIKTWWWSTVLHSFVIYRLKHMIYPPWPEECLKRKQTNLCIRVASRIWVWHPLPYGSRQDRPQIHSVHCTTSANPF